jgi:hypothetical protein
MQRSGSDMSRPLATLAAKISRGGLIMDSVARAAAIRLSELQPAEAKRMLQAILDGPTSVVHSTPGGPITLYVQRQPFVTVEPATVLAARGRSRLTWSSPVKTQSKRDFPSWWLH